jgi:hypothetical protein
VNPEGSGGRYRICVESETTNYVAWKPWEGFILTDDPRVAFPFETADAAHEIAGRWTDAGSVFVERLVGVDRSRSG